MNLATTAVFDLFDTFKAVQQVSGFKTFLSSKAISLVQTESEGC